MTHSRGSRCQWILARRSSWSSRQAGWCSGRGDHKHWMRCATPAFECHWLPQQQCNCQSLRMTEVEKRRRSKGQQILKNIKYILKSLIKQPSGCCVTLTLVGLAMILELWAGFALVIVWAAAVEISHQAVALGLIVTRIRPAWVILHLQEDNRRSVGIDKWKKQTECFPQWITSSPHRLYQRSPADIRTWTHPAGCGSGHHFYTDCWHSDSSSSHSADPQIPPGKHTDSLWQPPGTTRCYQKSAPILTAFILFSWQNEKCPLTLKNNNDNNNKNKVLMEINASKDNRYLHV